MKTFLCVDQIFCCEYYWSILHVSSRVFVSASTLGSCIGWWTFLNTSALVAMTSQTRARKIKETRPIPELTIRFWNAKVQYLPGFSGSLQNWDHSALQVRAPTWAHMLSHTTTFQENTNFKNTWIIVTMTSRTHTRKIQEILNTKDWEPPPKRNVQETQIRVIYHSVINKNDLFLRERLSDTLLSLVGRAVSQAEQQLPQ